MPRAYVYYRAARAVLAQCGADIPQPEAFYAGALGTELFVYDHLLSRNSKTNASLADTMRTSHTCRFAMALQESANTPAQRSFAYGWLCHWAVACHVAPYELAHCEAGLFRGSNARAKAAASLQSYFYALDTAQAAVQAGDVLPRLTPDARAEIAALLARCLRDVYNTELSLLRLSDLFHRYAFWQSALCASRFYKRWFLSGLELLCLCPGRLHAMTTPAMPPSGGFLQNWNDPASGAPYLGGAEQAFAESVTASVSLVRAAVAVAQGRFSRKTLSTKLGSRNLLTGASLAAEE